MTMSIHVTRPMLDWHESTYCGIEDFDSTDETIIDYSYFSDNEYWTDPPIFLTDVDDVEICPECFAELTPLSPCKEDGDVIQVEHQKSRHSCYQTLCGIEMNGETKVSRHVFKENVLPNDDIPPEGRVPRLDCNACAAVETYEICRWDK